MKEASKLVAIDELGIDLVEEQHVFPIVGPMLGVGGAS
jgi:hypothetical protein